MGVTRDYEEYGKRGMRQSYVKSKKFWCAIAQNDNHR